MDKTGEIIIRRRADPVEEASKSGAWKVAHADFMTAMMAFFLVMWLVNSTNEEVKHGIAQFFNPIQLTDILAESRGLNDPGPRSGSDMESDGGGKPGPGGDGGGGTGDGSRDGGSAENSAYPEAALFENPYKALDAIMAEEDAKRLNGPALNLLSGLTVGPSGSQARDPFDPMSWSRPVLNGTGEDTPAERRPGGGIVTPMPGDATEPQPAAERTGPAEGPDDTPLLASGPGVAAKDRKGDAGEAAEIADPAAAAVAGEPETPPPAPAMAGGADGNAAGRTEMARAETAPAADAEAPTPAGPAVGLPAEAGTAVGEHTGPAGAGNAPEPLPASIAESIRQLTIALADVKDGNGPLVALEAVEGGVLINLTEGENRSMFGSGSASPSPELIQVIDRIASVVTSTEGLVVVRGHTDGRPYRTKAYDNWRLSTARAHMAAYMLIRGGVPESRIDHIEGFADRRLKRPDDPGAAENRRIEILVRTAAP